MRLVPQHVETDVARISGLVRADNMTVESYFHHQVRDSFDLPVSLSCESLELVNQEEHSSASDSCSGEGESGG